MISIVIPAYKEEKWIKDTVLQFKQLRLPHEVIVSDGKSPDHTAQIAKECADKVVVFGGGRKHNAAIGRNDGAKVASGEFFVFLDSSSVIPDINTFFEKALKHFDDPDLVALNVYQWISPEVETLTDKIMLSLTNISLRFQNNMLHRGIGSGKFMMMRAAAFKEVGGFREELAVGEDGDMVRRLSRIGRTHIDPSLAILYPGRREHRIGWLWLFSQWIKDWFLVNFFGRSGVDQWEAIR